MSKKSISQELLEKYNKDTINESSSSLKIDRISYLDSMKDPIITLVVKRGYEEFNFDFHLYEKRVEYRLHAHRLGAPYSSEVNDAIKSLEDSYDLGEPFNEIDEKVVLDYIVTLLK